MGYFFTEKKKRGVSNYSKTRGKFTSILLMKEAFKKTIDTVKLHNFQRSGQWNFSVWLYDLNIWYLKNQFIVWFFSPKKNSEVTVIMMCRILDGNKYIIIIECVAFRAVFLEAGEILELKSFGSNLVLLKLTLVLKINLIIWKCFYKN